MLTGEHPTITVLLIVGENKALRARALETAGGVGASTELALVGLQLTLIDV